MSQAVRIVDQSRNIVAVAQVEDEDEGRHFSGAVDLSRMPSALRLKFEEFEDLVNNQVFSLLDQIEEQINAFSFKAVFDDGREMPVENLQIFPKEGTVSFQLTNSAEVRGI